MKYAHITVEVQFVAHGFQLDIYDRTLATADGQGILHRIECHDFADSSVSICDRAKAASDAIVHAMRSLRSQPSTQPAQ